MKSILWLLLLAVSSVKAQNLDKSLLWKVSGNGIAEPSYLFGTIHSTCNADLAAIEKLLPEISQVYFEIDISQQIPDSLVDDSMFMKNGRKLSDMMSESDFKTLSSFIERHISTPISIANYFKPEVVNNLLTSKVRECHKPYTIMYIGEEIALLTKSKKIFGLETFSEQSALLESIPYEVQLEGLMRNVEDDLASAKMRVKKIMALYSLQDIEGLYELFQTTNNKTYSSYVNLWLSDRNKKWVAQMMAASKSEPTLFTIGVSHLAGEHGVIKLLRKEGYTVEAVTQ